MFDSHLARPLPLAVVARVFPLGETLKALDRLSRLVGGFSFMGRVLTHFLASLEPRPDRT